MKPMTPIHCVWAFQCVALTGKKDYRGLGTEKRGHSEEK